MQNDIADALKQLTQNFIDSNFDRLNALDEIIDNIYNARGDRGKQYMVLLHEIHSLKGNAGTFGFPLVSVICHRLEDYLESSKRLEKNQWLEVQKFLDEIHKIFEHGSDPDQSLHSSILANLPSSAIKSKALDSMVLLVMEPGVIRTILGTALMEEGVHVSYAVNSIEALNMALTLKPDMIAAGQQLTPITGLELANALRGIAATKNISFVLLTADKDLKAPKGTQVIFKDRKVADHILNILSRE